METEDKFEMEVDEEPKHKQSSFIDTIFIVVGY